MVTTSPSVQRRRAAEVVEVSISNIGRLGTFHSNNIIVKGTMSAGAHAH